MKALLFRIHVGLLLLHAVWIYRLLRESFSTAMSIKVVNTSLGQGKGQGSEPLLQLQNLRTTKLVIKVNVSCFIFLLALIACMVGSWRMYVMFVILLPHLPPECAATPGLSVKSEGRS